MSEDSAVKEQLLERIADAHEHFVELMNERLPDVGTRELELYLAVMSKLLLKLEQRQKSMREAAQEMFAEVAALVMGELGR